MKTAVLTADAPAAIGPYSQAVIAPAGQMLFLSGQVGINPATGQVVEGGVEVQAERVLDNLEAVLHAGGADFHDVVKTTIFLKDINDFSAVNAVYARRFAQPFPARATVEVARLPRDVLVEIDAIAVLRPR